MLEDGPADKCGQIYDGDRIVAINGTDTENMPFQDVRAVCVCVSR